MSTTPSDVERDRLLSPSRIYFEPAAAELPRGQQVLARFPDATRVEVAGHWRIPELHGDETNVRRWVRIKREALVLGIKKSLTARPNGRSADHGLRQHRPDHRVPRRPHRPAGPEAGAQPV